LEYNFKKLKVKSNGDDDILAIRNINPQELVRYRDLKNQGHQHDMIGTDNAKFGRKVVLLYLTQHKGHALPGNTNANNSFAE
jgi:hypothetical protein